MNRYQSLLPLALLIATTAVASESGLTPEFIVGLQAVEESALSPDGRYVVYRTNVWPEGAGPKTRIARLWRMPATGGDREPFAGDSFTAHSPQWSPDGSRIAWIARAHRDSPSQLFVSPSAGGTPRQLTTAVTGIETFRWSRGSTRVGFLSNDAPGDEAVTGKDWIVVGEWRKQRRLYVVDLETGRQTRITNQDMTVHDFAWSPNGETIALIAAPGPDEDSQLLRSRPYLVPAGGGDLVLLAETEGNVSHPAWSGDGRWVAWLGSTSVIDPSDGSVFVAAAKEPGKWRTLTDGFAGTARWLGPLPGEPATFAFVAEERQNVVLRSVTVEGAVIRTISAPSQVVSGGPSFDGDGNRFAVVASSPEHPRELFIADRTDSRKLRRLTWSNPALTGIELGSQTIFRWRSKDGTPIEGVLLTPPHYRKDIRYPVVLHIHGGSEGVDSNGWQASPLNFGKLLAGRGFVVLYPNYRGSRGRGVEFVSGNRKDMMGRSWEDIESGLDALIDAGIADGERAGIYGFSWGGYAAGWGATYASHRFKAAVAGAGIYNWISEAGSNSSRMHEQLAHWDAPLYENFGLYLERSPIFQIHRANTPILLLHGENDESCPVGQALEFHTALRWKGVPSELVIYPREEHGMSEYQHQLDFLTRGAGWFDRLR